MTKSKKEIIESNRLKGRILLTFMCGNKKVKQIRTKLKNDFGVEEKEKFSTYSIKDYTNKVNHSSSFTSIVQQFIEKGILFNNSEAKLDELYFNNKYFIQEVFLFLDEENNVEISKNLKLDMDFSGILEYYFECYKSTLLFLTLKNEKLKNKLIKNNEKVIEKYISNNKDFSSKDLINKRLFENQLVRGEERFVLKNKNFGLTEIYEGFIFFLLNNEKEIFLFYKDKFDKSSFEKFEVLIDEIKDYFYNKYYFMALGHEINLLKI